MGKKKILVLEEKPRVLGDDADLVHMQFMSLRPGDKVEITKEPLHDRDGRRVNAFTAVGKVVICSQENLGVVTLNMGGPYGIPGICTEKNFVKIVSKGRKTKGGQP